MILIITQSNRMKRAYLLTGFIFISGAIPAQNVGIGTTAPASKLHIKGTVDTTQLIIDANNTQNNGHPLIKLRSSNGYELMWIHSDDSTNSFVGLNAGRVNNSVAGGQLNTFVGSSAGFSNTTGGYNTAVGCRTLHANTTGMANTAIGYGSLHSNSTGNNNVAIGESALYFNTTGYANTANGNQSLLYNTTGYYNTASGAAALHDNSTGYNNTATGESALSYNTSGYNNTANGTAALLSNTTGSYNTADGYQSLSSNLTGSSNTANGAYSLYSNTTAAYNTANGNSALYYNTTGNYNSALGYGALYSNTTSSNNSAMGYEALFSNTTGFNNSALGYNALTSNTTGFDNAAMGNGALSLNTTGFQNAAMGSLALSSNTTGYSNTAIGKNALDFNSTGHGNVAVGFGSGTSFTVPDASNTISIGNSTYLNGFSNQAFFGGTSTLWNGGNVGWSTFSDARVKRDISEDVKGLAFINLLRPVTYFRSIKAMARVTGNKEAEDYPGKYDIEKIKFSGFLAQEVEQAANEAGYNFSGITKPKTNNDLYSLSYESFVVPLVKAVQELTQFANKQQKTIEEQARQLEYLLREIEKMKKKGR